MKLAGNISYKGEKKMKQCADCRDAEHENYDNDVVLATVKDPETAKILKRAYLCAEHREMYFDDGYQIFIKIN